MVKKRAAAVRTVKVTAKADAAVVKKPTGPVVSADNFNTVPPVVSADNFNTP